MITDKSLLSASWSQDDYNAEHCMMCTKAVGTKDNWLSSAWTRFSKFCVSRLIAPRATLANIISCLEWDTSEGPVSITISKDPTCLLHQWRPAMECLSKLQGYNVNKQQMEESNGYKFAFARLKKLGKLNLHGWVAVLQDNHASARSHHC